jgi:large subunit ribosomal protein L19
LPKQPNYHVLRKSRASGTGSGRERVWMWRSLALEPNRDCGLVAMAALRRVTAVLRSMQSSGVTHARNISTGGGGGHGATGSRREEALGPPLTRQRLRDRYCTGPYEPRGEPRPVYPKRKSPFKRAQALIDALHDEETARLVCTGRAIFPTKIPYLRAGDVVRVAYLVDGERTKPSYFSGICIAIKNRGLGSSFVLRNVIDGVAVERSWPTYSPLILDAQVLDKKPVRRNKLWYLREKPLRESTFGRATERPKLDTR